MDNDVTDVDPELVPVLGAGVGPLYPVGAARHNDVTWLRIPEDDVMPDISVWIILFLLDKAVGGGDQDHWVTAQEDSRAPEEATVAVEEGALPGELVLLSDGPAQDSLVTLPPTSGRIFQSWIMSLTNARTY